MFAINEIVDHATLDRAGAVKRIESGEVFDGVGLITPEYISHAM